MCFCISSYVHKQLHSLDCQKFGHHNSLVFFYLTYLGTSPGAGFQNGDLQFSKLFKNTICIGVCTLKCTAKLSSLLPPSIFSLNLSPIQNLKEALIMSPGMYTLYHTSLRNYASLSLQVPSILSIIIAFTCIWYMYNFIVHTHTVQMYMHIRKHQINIKGPCC
jgi:hypothetical protein